MNSTRREPGAPAFAMVRPPALAATRGPGSDPGCGGEATPRRLELDDAGRIEAARAARPGAPPDDVNPRGRRVGGRVHTVLRERHRPKRGPPRG